MTDKKVGWDFKRQWSDDGSSGGIPAEYALDTTLEGLVRELWQNLNDEGPIDDEQPVRAVAHVNELRDDDLDTFRRALDWNADGNDSDGETISQEDLGDHLRSVARTDDTFAGFLEEVEDEARLVTLTVEDRNTRGLLGEGGGDKTFSALTLDELNNSKLDEYSGGSYGLGKFTCPAWSGVSTVLYSSTLSKPDPKDDDPRLFGRAYLPTHDEPDEEVIYEYEGTGYFGSLIGTGRGTVLSDDNDLYVYAGREGHPVSVWGTEAEELLNALSIPRTIDSSGTSVTVVGVCPPGESSQPPGDELAQDIATAVSRWFWPALTVGDLETTVEAPDETIEVGATYADEVRPFVEAFERRFNTVEQLDQPGDVVVSSPTIEVPDKDDGTPTKDGPIDIYARLADPSAEGPATEYRDRVAWVRGAGMVVKYDRRDNVVYGDRHFHGLVLAGRARGWGRDTTQSDGDIDNFLKAAEPPSHDDWRGRDPPKNLTENYERGAAQRVKDLRSEITRQLQDLIGGSTTEGEVVAPDLGRRFGLTGRGPPTGGGERAVSVKELREFGYDSEAGRWVYEAQLSPRRSDYERWEVKLKIARIDDDGRAVDTIEVDDVEHDVSPSLVDPTGSDERYQLTIGGSVDEITLDIGSVPVDGEGEAIIELEGTVYVTEDD